MENIEVGDRVQIINADDKTQLYKFGVMIMVVDGLRCVVQLDDGNGATVNISQLKKVG